ncbi:hypothetical protein jhhlp_007960 [Lomentospora prolificans]|uniref:Uncharacterized protein n=1 Tax=Lomentospora prolificans TaxID=41688 RepID=A0A2N3MZT8_9PEZI|nr:hypothetical protein jhhlp_007960 [Lomentospora prolificans]
MDCHLSPDADIQLEGGISLPLSYFNLTEHVQPCLEKGAATYIRPDHGGSLLPWPYALALLMIHLPVTTLRVTRWPKVQALSIVLAVVSIFLTAQAYTTHLEPKYVMVWMPLFIILDIGAMMQLAYLIIDETGIVLLWCAMKNTFGLFRLRGAHTSQRQITRWRQSASELDHPQTAYNNNSTVQTVSLPPTVPRGYDLASKAWLTTLSFLLMLTLIGLQLAGLAYAALAIRRLPGDKDMEAKWCSPVFQGARSIIADCEIQDVHPGENETVYCAKLPGRDQKRWLAATVAILSLSLVAQLIDATILLFASRRVKRPWLSMFFGNLILLGVMGVSVYNSLRVPVDMSKGVWVFKALPGGQAQVCEANLRGPGIRGEIIGWTDGFLASWGDAYYGA